MNLLLFILNDMISNNDNSVFIILYSLNTFNSTLLVLYT